MARTIGIGVMGLGWMGEVHSRCYRLISDRFHDSGIQARLIVCADEIEERARSGCARFGFERWTTDWREVLIDPEVEVISVTTPNYLHLELARAAAQAGKHIFCEKPVGRSPEETAEIEKAVRQAGVLSWVGYNYRWAPLVQYARELIAEGRLGGLTHYRGRFFAGYGSNPNSVLSWRFQQELAGSGTLGDLLSHAIDMAHMLAGPVRRVVGNRETFIPERPLPAPDIKTHFDTRQAGPRGKVSNEDYVGVLVQFENGAHGTLEACRIISGPKCQMAFEVHGAQGALRWDFERMNELEVYLPREDPSHDGYVRILSGPSHPFHSRFNPGPGIGMGYEDLKLIEAFQFLSSVARGEPGEPNFTQALNVARVQQAIIRSWQSEKWEEVLGVGFGVRD